MNKNFFQNKTIMSTYIIVFAFLIIGLTYAIQTSSVAINVNSALIGVDESAYGDLTFNSNGLDFRPILDSEVETSTNNVVKIDFKVGAASTNTTDNVIYDIALNDLKLSCNLLSPYIKWKLLKNGTEISTGSLDYRFDTITNGRLVLTPIQQDLQPYNATDKSGYDDYTFYMWFSDSCQNADIKSCTNRADQSSLLGQNLIGKIEVELYTGSKKELTRNPSTTLDGTTCGYNNYIVTYAANGGTLSTTSSTVVTGSPYGELPTPTKSSTISFETNGGNAVASQTATYTFEGWYTDDSFIELVNSDTEVTETSNHTLYAKWSGGSITLPEPTRSGYAFLGWYSDSNLTNKVGNADEAYTPTSNMTLYANWLSLDSKAPVGTITTTSTFKSTTQTATLTCTDSEGVTGYYWGTEEPTESSSYTSITSTTLFSTAKTISGAGTYYLSCKDNSGNISNTTSKTYRDYHVHNMLLETTGIAGVYTTQNYSSRSVNSTPYIIPVHTIMDLSSIYTIPAGANSSTLRGYSITASDQTEASLSLSNPTIIVKTVYYIWFDRITYPITYNACNGTGAPSTQYKRYGVSVTLSSTKPTRSGYTFAGWSSNTSSGCSATSATYAAGTTATYSTNANLNLYAVWRPIYLSSKAVGSYVAYTGNNGCPSGHCDGTNANYVSDTNMGYCNNSNYKFSVNGWRIGYKENGSAYLVSAGAPECVVTYMDSKSNSTILVGLSTNYYYGSGYTFDESTGKFTLTGVTPSTLAWSSHYNSIIENTPYTCMSTSSNGTCPHLYEIASYYSSTQAYYYPHYNFETTYGTPIHLANLNNQALKYCNNDYIYGGSCNSNSAWAMNASDFKKITGSDLSKNSCNGETANEACGYNNSLIDNGGFYWFATASDPTSSRGIFQWHPPSSHVRDDPTTGTSAHSHGMRPVLYLDPTVLVTGGTGTYADPYTITK